MGSYNTMTRKDKISLFLFVILLALTVIMAKPSRLFAQTTIAYDDNDNGALFEAIALGNASHDTVYHCEFAIDTFTITNTGDTILDDIVIGSANFYGVINSAYSIPPECIYFTPSYLSELSPGSTVTIEAHIYVPCGLFAQDYKGKVYARDDDGYPRDTIELWITVLPRYDLDIANYQLNLVGNILYLCELPGYNVSGQFLLLNPNCEGLNVDPDSFGNADLTNLTYSATNLVGPGPDITTANISIIPTPLILASGCMDTLLYMVDIPVYQSAGLYEGSVYVTSPGEDESGDSFYVNLFVGSVESITLTGTLDQTVDHGVTAIDTFTVINNGNGDLDNIIFEVTDLYDSAGHMIVDENVIFDPTSIDVLVATDSFDIKVYVNVPLGTYATTYTGNVIVKDDDGYPLSTIDINITVNPSYDLDICDDALSLSLNTMELIGLPGTSPTGNFLLINPNSNAMNADPDSFGNSDLLDIAAVSTVLHHVDNPLYSIPTDSVFIAVSQTLLSGSDDAVPVVVNIPDGQEEGVYVGTIIVWDMVIGVFDDFEILVQVGAEEDVDIIETVTSGSGDHGTMVDLTTFTVENTGNTDLYNLLFNTSGLESGDYFLPPEDIYLYVTNFWAPVNDAVIDVLLIGETADVQAAVDVRRGQHAGTYFGFIRIFDDDGVPSDAIAVSLEVLSSYDLDIVDNGGDVIGNNLTLDGYAGDVLTGEFDIYNPNNEIQNVDPDPFGNDDLIDITYTVTDLQQQTNPAVFIDTSAVTVSAPASLISGYAATGTLTVTVPDGQEEGVYIGIVKATDVSGVTDSFNLILTVYPEGITEFSDTTQESTCFISLSRPNPFSEKTTIDISLKLLWSNGAGRLQTTDQIQQTSVCIYDLSGHLVRTLPLNLCNLNKSVQSVIWDGRDDSGKEVPNGIYFLKFDAGKYTETQKLIKVR